MWGNAHIQAKTWSIRAASPLAEISAASLDQSEGIERIHHAIIDVGEGAQHNAALVEEDAAAAEALAQQAQHLEQLVAAFKLEPGRAVQVG